MYLAWSPAPNPRVPCDSKGYTHTHPSPNGTVPKHLPSQERYRGARSSQEKAGFFGLSRRMGKLSNELPGLYETVAPEALKRILEEKNPEFAGTWASAPCKKLPERCFEACERQKGNRTRHPPRSIVSTGKDGDLDLLAAVIEFFLFLFRESGSPGSKG